MCNAIQSNPTLLQSRLKKLRMFYMIICDNDDGDGGDDGGDDGDGDGDGDLIHCRASPKAAHILAARISGDAFEGRGALGSCLSCGFW